MGAADHSEFFGFEPGANFKMKDFETYANEFKSQYFERQETVPSSICTGKWDPPLDTIEGEYWRIVESATEQIEVMNLSYSVTTLGGPRKAAVQF